MYVEPNQVVKHLGENDELMQDLPLELEIKLRKEAAQNKKRRRFSPNIKRNQDRRKRTKMVT